MDTSKHPKSLKGMAGIMPMAILCFACVEPLSSSSQKEESAIPLEVEEKHIQASRTLLSFSFQQTTSLSEGLKRVRLQEGQIRSAFLKNGPFQMCGGLLDSVTVKGDAPLPDGLPSGMVREHKVNQSKTTLSIQGYSGSWREEGEWMVGSIDKVSPKGQCDGSQQPFSGGRFWCTKLSHAPLTELTLCGFEKPPIRSDWQTSLSPLSLEKELTFPYKIKVQELHWIVIGNADGILWEWSPDKGGEQHQFHSKSMAFDLDSLRAKAK